MQKYVKGICLFLLLTVLFSVTAFAETPMYQIGEGEPGLLNDEKIKDAFVKAADKFSEWLYEGVPSGFVTKEGDYYVQNFTDGEDQNAAIYVGPDYRTYTMRGPIYQQLRSLGGTEGTGLPTSDAYEVNGVWYQNFEKGYAKTTGDNGKAVFVKDASVDEQGQEKTAGTDGSGLNTISDRASDLTEDLSNAVSDVTEPIKKTFPKWAMWLIWILVILAVVLLIVWLMKKKKND